MVDEAEPNILSGSAFSFLSVLTFGDIMNKLKRLQTTLIKKIRNPHAPILIIDKKKRLNIKRRYHS
jgi:hypothetical protein